MAEPEYPVLRELETKLKLQWIDTDDYLATQRAIIQVEPEAAYLELPRGRKGDKGDPGPAISIQGIVAADSQLPANAEIGHAYVNTSTKGLAVWNGAQWFKVDNFAGVDADVQQFSRWFAQIESDSRRAVDAAERAEFAAEETIQQVEGDFATKNYADSKDWNKGFINDTHVTMADVPIGVWGISARNHAERLGLPSDFGSLQVMLIGSSKTAFFLGQTTGFWTATEQGGVWGEWKKTPDFDDLTATAQVGGAGLKTAAVALTAGSLPDGTPGRVRLLTQVTAPVTRWRVHIESRRMVYEASSDFVLGSVYVGHHTGGGNATGLTTLKTGNITVPGSVEWKSKWITHDLSQETVVDFEVSGTGLFSYQAPGYKYENGGWVPTKNSAASVWIEVETPAQTPVVALIGDSTGVGQGANFPVHESALHIAARKHRFIPMLYAYPGSSMQSINNREHHLFRRWSGLTVPDSVIIQSGSNDIHAGTSVADLRTRFTALAELARTISPVVIGSTVKARYPDSGAHQTNLNSHNTWVRTQPAGIRDFLDFYAKLSPNGTVAAADAADAAHLTSSGHRKLALAFDDVTVARAGGENWYRGDSASLTITSLDDLPYGVVEMLNASLAGDLGLPVVNPGVIETYTMGTESGYQRWLSQKNLLPTEHIRRRSSAGWGAWEVVNAEAIDSKADKEYVDGELASKMDAHRLDSVLGVGPDLAESYAGRVVQLNSSGQLVLNTESITSPKSPINREWAETSLGEVYVQQKSGLRYVDDWLNANGYGRFHEGVQACIDRAPVNSTLIFAPNFTYNLQGDGPLVIPRTMTLTGGTFRTETGKVFYTEADGVTLQNMRIYGHQNITPDTYIPSANMVEFRGASGSSRIKATVRNLRVERASHEAISLHYVEDFTVENCDIEDFNYGAIMVYCGNDGIIRGNRIKNGIAGANMTIVYGIELSDLDATEATRCRRILVTENLVEDVTIWEGIDSHGGMEITISNNIIHRCKHGVVITVGSLSNRTTAPEKIIITGNHVSGGGLSFSAGISIGGGVLDDGTVLTADCLVTGNHVADTTRPINIPPARNFLTPRTSIRGNVGHWDAGLRNINDMVDGYTSGFVYARRTEDLVHIHFEGLVIAPEENPFWFVLFTLPEGMRPQRTMHMRMDMGLGSEPAVRYISVNSNGEFRINYPQDHTGEMYGYLTFSPKDLTWPATLPGTPA